ncbi:MAG TPA: GNAT family N-acetyltransferase [Pirellulaceae bacterium]|nr:GNAT family N-acetyltransferase [Pirellulaceae bacterium]HMO93222.1 GNAT family N-acetyltransferase [Pirellulaceae bacterium]HMP70053.1 GNAT family N-acetyltransferase [Pirellulaceae bacterium]
MNANPLQFDLVRDTSLFKAMRNDWEMFGVANPMLSWEWLYSWWEAFQSGKELLLVRVQDQTGQLVALVPWYKTVNLGGVRVIRTLGDGKACSDYVSIICMRENQAEVERQLATALLTNRGFQRQIGRWDWIEFEGHSEDCYAEFFAACRAHRLELYTREIERAWVVNLGSSISSYESSLNSSFRRKLRRAQSLLRGPRVRFVLIESQEEFAQAWTTFCELHQKRRKSLNQPGCFTDSKFEAFLRNSTQRLLVSRQAMLTQIWVDGNPIASDLLLRARSGFQKYQTGVDPQFMSWEPGHLITAAEISYSISEGLAEFDFLRGDEPYKRSWAARANRLFTSRIVSTSQAARISHRAWLAARTLKRQWTWFHANFFQTHSHQREGV